MLPGTDLACVQLQGAVSLPAYTFNNIISEVLPVKVSWQ